MYFLYCDGHLLISLFEKVAAAYPSGSRKEEACSAFPLK